MYVPSNLEIKNENVEAENMQFLSDDKVTLWDYPEQKRWIDPFRYMESMGNVEVLDPADTERALSFYGKAHVITYKSSNNAIFQVLKSYQSYIALRVRLLDPVYQVTEIFRLKGHKWSQTTTRHIKSFIYPHALDFYVNHALKKYKGGYANRLSQAGDIVVVKGNDGTHAVYSESEGRIDFNA